MKFLARGFVAASLAATAVLIAPPAAHSEMTSKPKGQMQAIDTECNAIQSAIQALAPVHLVFVNSKWTVMNEGDYTAAERTTKSIVFVDAWKQGKAYAWIHSHAFDAQGNQRATQLCFRQSDGTLERVRQASTVPDLGAASAKQAYYASDGTVIQKTSLFEVDDPAIAKKISDLPFFSELP